MRTIQVGHFCTEIKNYEHGVAEEVTNTHKVETDGNSLAFYDPDFTENYFLCQLSLI